MSYLARLKQLDGAENFTYSPEPVLPKLTKGGYGGFVSTAQGAYVNISASNEAHQVGADDTAIEAELPNPDPYPDDRRTCSQCKNLSGRVCTIACPGGVVSAVKGYTPNQTTLIRCAGFVARGTA